MTQKVTELELTEARRRLAAAMLEAHAARAFDNPISDEDAEFLKAELAACDAKLAQLRKS
jgi:hypothetical protein